MHLFLNDSYLVTENWIKVALTPLGDLHVGDIDRRLAEIR